MIKYLKKIGDGWCSSTKHLNNLSFIYHWYLIQVIKSMKYKCIKIYYHFPRILRVSDSFYSLWSETIRVRWLLLTELFFDPNEFLLVLSLEMSNFELASNKFLPLPFLKLLFNPFYKSKKLNESYYPFYFFMLILAICLAGVLLPLITGTLLSFCFWIYFRFWYRDYWWVQYI